MNWVPTVPWWVWGLLANIAIMVIEWLNRSGGFASYFHALRFTLPLIFVAQMGLFYAWRDAPTMMLAWAAFTLGNTVLRLVNTTWMVGEIPSLSTLFGVALITAGAYCVKIGG